MPLTLISLVDADAPIVSDGAQTFLALSVSSANEVTTHVLLVPLTPERFALTDTRTRTFDALSEGDRSLACIEWDDWSLQFREADGDTYEPIVDGGDVAMPDMSDDGEVRVDSSTVSIGSTTITFSAITKYGDEHLSATIWRDQFDAVRVAYEATR